MKLRRFLVMFLAALLVIGAIPPYAQAARSGYDMPYYIEVDLTNQIVTIYSTDTDVIVRQMLCSSGTDEAPTPRGTFYLPRKEEKLEREEWYYFRAYSCYAHYATRIYKGVLFHSIPCSRRSDSTISQKALSEFGKPASHGCLRLRWQDAEFIAKCCLEGTRVHIFKSKKPDKELRELLYAASYTNERGQSYKAYLGIPDVEGVMGRYSKGSDVRDLQTRLRDLGIFNDEIDGEYGGSTVNAVRQAQRLMGVEESGVATLEFQDVIYSDDAPTAQNVTVQEGSSGPVVRNMQQYLTELRLYNGALDGVFDLDVTDAVKKFQGAYGYRTDGVLTPVIQKALYYEAGKVRAIFSQDDDYDFEMTGGQVYMGQVVTRVGIRLREKASASSTALDRLASGDVVVALEHGKGWSKVQRGENIGYVRNEFVEYYTQDIYALNYTSKTSGYVYTIGYTAKEYYNGAIIQAEDFSEYLASNGSLDNYEGISTFARVNTEGPDVALRLREAPNTNSTIMAMVPYGTELRVMLRSSEWSLVEFEGQNGYLMNEYLEFWQAIDEGGESAYTTEEELVAEGDNSTLPAVVHATTAPEAPVYDVDSDDANVLGHLKDGTRVEVVETVDGWSLISYQGHTGYMKDADLQFMLAEELRT
ncbi:MAG: SH3 domain-containing protein [Clostridia bacterium]|nr:SH3 domain-containing protein [Clostridia bacterium]